MNDELKEIKEERLLRLKILGERLDESIKIPGTDYKMGLDSIIGAVPVIGDLIGGVLSTYILYSGIKLGAPPKIVAQMATNIAIDFAIGSIPIIGDIFDIIWKANVKNIELIEQNTLDNEGNKGTNYLITATLVVALLVIILVILGIVS